MDQGREILKAWPLLGVLIGWNFLHGSVTFCQEATVVRATPPTVDTFEWGVRPILQPNIGHRGAASCAASSCHGGPKPAVATATAARGSEYTLWLQEDPHARSWQTISSEQSTRMLIKLGIIKNGKLDNRSAYENCLACHSSTIQISADGLTPVIAEGVGCEACHGPANTWYDQHYQEVRVRSDQQTQLKPLIQRAKLCVACHVGSVDRDMNHDLIAAGHPALYFDMAVYHDTYPKHWRERTGSSDMRSRLWLAGQIAALIAELELLEARASQKLPHEVWPELSLYSCTSCHLSLDGVPRLLQSDESARVLSGEIPPRRWNLDNIEPLEKYLQTIIAVDLQTPINRLKQALVKNPPAAREAIALARSLRLQIESALGLSNDRELIRWSSSSQKDEALRLLSSPATASEWESAARFYIATWSVREEADSAILWDSMQTIRKALVFPKDFQSPEFPRSRTSESPPNFDQWKEALQRAALGLLEGRFP